MAKKCRSCCAAPSCGPLCVTITGSGDLSGIIVTARYQQITSVTITNGGNSYVTAPSVTFSTTNGAGGTGVATIDGSGHVTGVTITAGGAYVGPVQVSFAGGGAGAAGAAGTVVLSADLTAGTCAITGTVTSVSRTAGGSGYTAIPTVNFAGGGGGSGATAAVTMAVPNAAAIAIADGGTGYAVGNVLTVVGGTQAATCRFTVASVAAGGVITGVTLTAGGSYSVLPANPVSVTGGVGSGAKFNLTWTVATVTLTGGGSGYTSAPTVTFSGGGGSGATATATFAYRCCINAPVAGRYKVSTDACTPASTNVNVTCPAGGNVTIQSQGSVFVPLYPCQVPCSGSVLLQQLGGHTWKFTGNGVNGGGTAQLIAGGLCAVLVNFSKFGTYTLEGPIGPCYESQTKTLTINQCSGTLATSITPVPKKYSRRYKVTGCASLPLQGAALTATGPDFSQTATSDADGIAAFTGLPADCTLTLTGTHPRFVSPAPSDFGGKCADDDTLWNFGFSTPIAGYVCAGCVSYPLPTTLHGTCSEGAITLTYQTAGSGIAGAWVGCKDVSGKTVACIQANCACARTEVPPFPTDFFQGPSAVAMTFSGACGAGVTVPSCLDQNDLDPGGSGARYKPMPSCCSSYGGTPWPALMSMKHCNPQLAEDTCPPTTGVVANPGCGATASGVPTGTPPPVPPYSCTWSIDMGSVGYPTGTITITE